MIGGIRQEIYNAMVLALGRIKIVRGFQTDVAASQKVLLPNTANALPLVVTTFHEEQKEITTYDHYQCDLGFSVSCHITQVKESSGDSPEDAVNTFLADVEKAILDEDAKPYPLGIEAVQQIKLTGHTKHVYDAETIHGFEVTGSIVYRHSVTSPEIA